MEALDYQNIPIQHGSPEAQKTVCKVISRIQADWNFTNAKMAQLLHIRPNTYGNWLKAEKVPLGSPPFTADTEAVICVIAIHRSLSAMFSSTHDQVVWLTNPHPDFASQCPLDFAISNCGNLFYLKAYLDTVRGRGA